MEPALLRELVRVDTEMAYGGGGPRRRAAFEPTVGGRQRRKIERVGVHPGPRDDVLGGRQLIRSARAGCGAPEHPGDRAPLQVECAVHLKSEVR